MILTVDDSQSDICTFPAKTQSYCHGSSFTNTLSAHTA